MAAYQPVTPRLIEKLRYIVGERNVLITEEERQAYSCDEMCLPERYLPDVVVKPANSQQVAAVLSLASALYRRRGPKSLRTTALLRTP